MLTVPVQSEDGLDQYLLRLKHALVLRNNYENLKSNVKNTIICEEFNKCLVAERNSVAEWQNNYLIKMKSQPLHKNISAFLMKLKTCEKNICFNNATYNKAVSEISSELDANCESSSTDVSEKSFENECNIIENLIHEEADDKRNTTESSHLCVHCKCVFLSNNEYFEHRIKGCEKQKYLCEKCGSEMRTSYILARHQKSCNGEERPFICSICNMSFKVNLHLRRHFNAHSKDKLYTCGHCDKSFHRKDYLHKHIKSHKKKHRKSKKQYPCVNRN